MPMMNHIHNSLDFTVSEIYEIVKKPMPAEHAKINLCFRPLSSFGNPIIQPSQYSHMHC
jgi:hypothetical protein